MIGPARIGFVGMTHLGLVSAIAAASKGRNVVCFDQSETLIDDLVAGRFAVSEPGLENTATEHSAQISFTSDLRSLESCDIVFLSVDVPTDNAGNSDLNPILDHFRLIKRSVNQSAIVVILCQVPPGFTRSLEFDKSRLIYQVETLVFGRALERATFPERFIVGSSDSNQPLPDTLLEFLDSFGCPVLHMSYESAELAKIAINLFLVSSISTTNMLSDVCERIGATWADIVPALRLDARIGPHAYLTPGLGIGGGNLERDVTTIRHIGERSGAAVNLADVWMTNSNNRKMWVTQVIKNMFPTDWTEKHVCVLGLAYKENTASTKNSPALELLRALKGAKITVHDPVVLIDQNEYNARQASTALQAANGADVVAIMTPWPQYRDLNSEVLEDVMSGTLLIDPFGVMSSSDVARTSLKYITLGCALN